MVSIGERTQKPEQKLNLVRKRKYQLWVREAVHKRRPQSWGEAAPQLENIPWWGKIF